MRLRKNIPGYKGSWNEVTSHNFPYSHEKRWECAFP